MCGIVAFRGSSAAHPALPALLDGLSRLEYRGYDSTGVALNPGAGRPLRVHRALGRLPQLVAGLPVDGSLAQVGIAHTRWATHGAPSERNAHPHQDCSGRVVVVHNGTLDNADELRAKLCAAGHAVRTDVDSELIAHVIEDELAGIRVRGNPRRLATAVGRALRSLHGSWALAVLVHGFPGVVVA